MFSYEMPDYTEDSVSVNMMMMKTLFKHRVAHSAKAGIQRGPAQHYRFTSIEILIILNILNN